MTRDAVLQLLHRGTPLATSIPATSHARLAFVGVSPLDPERDLTAGMRQRFEMPPLDEATPIYRIRCFEIDRALIDADVWVSEDDLHNKRDALAIGDEELAAKLGEFGVNLEQLLQHFKTDYPI